MDGVKFTSVVVSLLFYSTVFSQFGVLDPSFGDNGKVTTVFGTENSLLYALAIQSDGKIIAGGTFGFEGLSRLAFSRYNLDGSLDVSFGTEGKSVITSFGIGLNLFSMVLQTDGKIVVVCDTYNPLLSRKEYYFARLNNDGSVDNSFGTQGLLAVPNGTFVSAIKSFAIHPDGKITAVGYTGDLSVSTEILVIQFNSDGSLNSSFGENGIQNIGFRVLDSATAIEILSDGKILVAGNSTGEWDDYYGYDYDFIIARFNANGTLDTAFGENGKTIVGIANKSEYLKYLKVQSDGKIMILGERNSEYPYIIEHVRFNSDGQPDTSFSSNGVVVTEITDDMASYPSSTNILAATQQPDGKIIASGYYSPGTACCSAVRMMRFLSNGDLDSTFGVNGIVSQISTIGQAYSIALQPDGKIVVSGSGGSGNPVHFDFIMYRYTSGLNLSASDFNSDAKISVYPNPINDLLNIDFKLTEDSNINIDLFDFSGRKVETLLDKQRITSGNHSINFQLPNTMSKGIYFLNIMNNSESKIVKLVK
ncbi:T9SS type A sorting domain-containing protein [Flavobacterium sp.]|uniref:T9SS type A sorting domain-containing protein n=1 Tax=Flavobacterium sp. TaxID=239 RepID=UPI0028BE6EFA|nr:T9SS type A sorting domain-containing protein [Flavobacterium sp.]